MPRKKIYLPKPTKTFLETPEGRWCLPHVRCFHHWMAARGLVLADLTGVHVDDFFAHEQQKGLAPSTQCVRRCLVHKYLYWLSANGHLRFVVDPPPLQRMRALPTSASDFVDSLRPVRKPSTCARYVHHLRDFHVWLDAAGLDITRFDRLAAERWLKSLADRGLAACTRNNHIYRVRSYLYWLHEHYDIDADPDDLLRVTDLPKIPSYLPRPFPPEADRELQKRFLASGTIYGQALFLMRRSGVRIGELVHLEPDCLERDLNDNIFLKVPLGKLDNERLVPLDPQARDVLKSLHEQCPHDAKFLICPQLSRLTLKTLLPQTLKESAAGLDIPGPVVSHRLRHSYATELLNAGLSLVTIMKLLGHRSFRMTMRYAAIAQNTIINDYNAAMDHIARKYDTQDTTPHSSPDLNLQRQTIDLISSLRKTADSRPEAKPRIDALIKRLYRISDGITALIQSLQSL